jgi:hypothetical protein
MSSMEQKCLMAHLRHWKSPDIFQQSPHVVDDVADALYDDVLESGRDASDGDAGVLFLCNLGVLKFLPFLYYKPQPFFAQLLRHLSLY